jgi:hypothetical protein
MFDMKTTVRPTPLQSIYEMEYGRESEIRQMLLHNFESGRQVIHLPDHEAVVAAAQYLRVETGDLLLAYRMIKANDHSDVIDAANGCGGVMDKYVDKSGAEYRCRLCSRSVATAD